MNIKQLHRSVLRNRNPDITTGTSTLDIDCTGGNATSSLEALESLLETALRNVNGGTTVDSCHCNLWTVQFRYLSGHESLGLTAQSPLAPVVVVPSTRRNWTAPEIPVPVERRATLQS